ncbi:MAG: DMT family transporter [Chromatiales bacterium]|jgi:drug/metabolite transporter (DMT)-like permease
MHWLPITLLCAFMLASSDAVVKKYLSQIDVRSLIVVRLGLAGLLMLPIGLTLPWPALTANFWLWMLLLVPLEITAMLLYVTAIRDYPLSLTLPYLAFTPAFAAINAWLILDEHISLYGLSGMLLIIIGAWLLNIPENRQHTARRALDPLRAIARNRGSRLMLTAALIYSISAVGSKSAMTGIAPLQFGAFYFGTIGMVALLLFGRGSLQPIRQHWRASLVVALFMAIMVFAHFLALSLTEVAYMISVKRLSLLFGILYGAWLFHEKHLSMHLFAAGLMLAGVFLISAF